MVTKFYEYSPTHRNSVINRFLPANSYVQPPKTHSADPDNVAWSAAGLHVETSRSRGLISAGIINRSAGEVSWRSDYHRVSVALTAERGTASVDGGPARSFRLLQGELSSIPGGVSTRVILPAVRAMEALQSPATYDTIISEIVRGGSIPLEALRAPINDPLVSKIVSTLAQEMESGFLDRILVDALNTALAVRILRHLVDPSKLALAPSNGLSRERLRRVCDYIEAHLDDRLILADLAGVACLSPYHFSRSFKKAVGVGPQRYVMERRIDRAKTPMRRTSQPLAWIALEVGFTDQSHLTAIFRREIGMTPGRFRAAVA
jgi:AraC family transcriptional regulator